MNTTTLLNHTPILGPFVTFTLQERPMTTSTITHLIVACIFWLPSVAKVLPAPVRWLASAAAILAVIQSVAWSTLQRSHLFTLRFLASVADRLPEHQATAVPEHLKQQLAHAKSALKANGTLQHLLLAVEHCFLEGKNVLHLHGDALRNAVPLFSPPNASLSPTEINHCKMSLKRLIAEIRKDEASGSFRLKEWANTLERFNLVCDARRLLRAYQSNELCARWDSFLQSLVQGKQRAGAPTQPPEVEPNFRLPQTSAAG